MGAQPGGPSWPNICIYAVRQVYIQEGSKATVQTEGSEKKNNAAKHKPAEVYGRMAEWNGAERRWEAGTAAPKAFGRGEN